MIIATHNGEFHADDVFGVALLKTLYPEAEFIRTRDESLLQTADIVLDVGAVYDPEERLFDHHQQGAPKRKNGITYSAFGLLWKEYGLRYCDDNKEVWQRIDRSLVQFIDAVDNGDELYELNERRASPYDITSIIGSMNPLAYKEEETFDEQFFKAVTLATEVLARLKVSIQDQLRSKEYFDVKYEETTDRRFVVLDKYMKVTGIAERYPELLFVVYPDETNDQWLIKTVRRSLATFESRQPLPETWASLRHEALARVTGVQDATFCHVKRFIAGAKSREGVMKLLKLALKG